MKENTAATTIRIGPEQAGMRLDRLARKLFAKKPLAWVYGEVRRGGFLVNGKKVSQSHRLEEGDEVTLPQAVAGAAQKRAPRRKWTGPKLTVIAEDEGWLAVDKPAGLLSQGGNEKQERSLVDWLASAYPDAEFTPAPAHRLDRQTSGLVLCAKKASVARALLQEFSGSGVRKEYLALVHGELHEPVTCSDPIATERSKDFSTQTVSDEGQDALTELAPLASAREFSLVLALPRTGRKHQIRVHLAHLGHPLVADGRYGGEAAPQLRVEANEFLLHAWRLAFKDPARPGRVVKLEAPLPLAFRAALEALKIDPDLVLQRARLAQDRSVAGE